MMYAKPRKKANTASVEAVRNPVNSNCGFFFSFVCYDKNVLEEKIKQ